MARTAMTVDTKTAAAMLGISAKSFLRLTSNYYGDYFVHPASSKNNAYQWLKRDITNLAKRYAKANANRSSVGAAA